MSIKLVESNRTMILQLLDGVKKMALNFGSLETHGDLIGVKMEI